MKQKEFMDLLVEYAKEISDPENKKVIYLMMNNEIFIGDILFKKLILSFFCENYKIFLFVS